MLTPVQAETLDRIEAALANIERLRLAINEAVHGSGLKIVPLVLPPVGLLQHAIEGVRFDGRSACAKASRQAGVDLQAAA